MSDSSFSVDLENEEEAQAILAALNEPHFLEPTFKRTGARLVGRMHIYPPRPPNSTYRRTLTYGRRWTFAVRRSLLSIGVEVGNDTIYGPYVGDPEMQAEIHQGRWQTTADALEAETPAIVDDVVGAIERQIDKAGR